MTTDLTPPKGNLQVGSPILLGKRLEMLSWEEKIKGYIWKMDTTALRKLYCEGDEGDNADDDGECSSAMDNGGALNNDTHISLTF